MKHYKLILDNLQPILFWADNKQLKYCLNTAYIAFKNKHNLNKALLYVHHPLQGWCQVFNADNCYQIISNPLTLDHKELILAVNHTLARSDLLPTEKQKQQKRKKDLRDERNIDAEIQRNTFHIVKTNTNKDS